MRANGLEFPVLERWPTPVQGAGLLDAILESINRYVVCPRYGPETLALWTLHTYAFPLRRVTTYIGIVSPRKRCGKTTLLTLLSMLANRAIMASNISPPALFRVIEEAQPTLLIDEADTFLRGNEELRGILNAGYTRESAYVIRVESSKKEKLKIKNSDEDDEGETPPSKDSMLDRRLVKFSSWCPKVMAAIGSLPETLTDRCIMITMQRKGPKDRCQRLREWDATDLQRRCLRWVDDNAEKIRSWQPEIPERLNDRAADVWEPLLVLAELAGGEWPARARAAAEGLSGREEEEGDGAAALLVIELLFRNSGQEKLFSRSIVEALSRFPVRPWEENGRPVDEQWLARQLREYGITPRVLWLDGQTGRGYLREDFEDVFGRYLPAHAETLQGDTIERQMGAP